MMMKHALIRSSRRTVLSFPRFYRGDSGEAVPKLSEKEQEFLNVALPRSEAILQQHVRFPRLEEIPRASLGPSDQVGEDLELEVRKKRLVYRSKQRGWLEVDLLLGAWAQLHVPQLSPSELDDYEAFVNMETIDIYNIITLRTDVPEDIKTEDGSGVVERIQAWARQHPLGKADPDTYKAVKTKHNLI